MARGTSYDFTEPETFFEKPENLISLKSLGATQLPFYVFQPRVTQQYYF